MTDFAKIIRATDGEQVLFYREDEGDVPMLVQVTNCDGVTATARLGFDKSDEGEAKRDKAWSDAGIEQADDMRRMVASALLGD